MTYAHKLASMFSEQDAQDVEYRFPVSAVIVNHDGSNATIIVPSFDASAQFGPIPYVHTAMPPGSNVLAVRDENDDWWVIAP